MLPQLESPRKGRENGKELGISHLHSEMLPGSQRSFVVLFIEVVHFYNSNLKKSSALYDLSCYRLGEQLLNNLCHLYDQINLYLK